MRDVPAYRNVADGTNLPSGPERYARPGDDEECRKLLLAELLRAPAVIEFDNLTGDLVAHKSLCTALTSEFMSGRILGISKTPLSAPVCCSSLAATMSVPTQRLRKAAHPLKGAAMSRYASTALKHGLLSRHVVLPHEYREEYDNLFAALFMEHQPGGPTELHLVEELAGILWRKRRVLMAEGAKINQGLKYAADDPKRVMPAAAPFARGFSGDHANLSELLTASAEELAERQRNAELDLAAARKAAAILDKGGQNAYEKAQRMHTTRMIPAVGHESVCPVNRRGRGFWLSEANVNPAATVQRQPGPRL